MDRFVWSQTAIPAAEVQAKASGVCLYDGETESAFKSGSLDIGTDKLLWIDEYDKLCKLELPLSLVLSHERQGKSFTKSAKIVLHLAACPSELLGQGPSNVCSSSHVKLSFRRGGEEQVYSALMSALNKRVWEKKGSLPMARQGRAAGIAGIERNLRDGFSKTSGDISQAFLDLTKLMDSAKEMVKLSKDISEKIRSRQGSITEDETIQFKSYLLSMGVQDPVTRDTFGSGDAYYKELAREISSVLCQAVKDSGGTMSLTDAYCRVNRARGLELISPEDMLQSCKHMEMLKLPIRLHCFDTGVIVLHLAELSTSEDAAKTESLVRSQQSLTADEFSALIGIPVLLGKQRLLNAENLGLLCRDESIEALRFYPNFFLHPSDENCT